MATSTQQLYNYDRHIHMCVYEYIYIYTYARILAEKKGFLWGTFFLFLFELSNFYLSKLSARFSANICGRFTCNVVSLCLFLYQTHNIFMYARVCCYVNISTQLMWYGFCFHFISLAHSHTHTRTLDVLKL